MTFLERIQLLVNRAGGQNALARKSGMSLGAIQRYLKGGEPTRSAMIRLTEAGGVTMNWLVYGTEDETQGALGRSYKLHGFGDSVRQKGWYEEVQYRITAALEWPDPDSFAVAAMDNALESEGIRAGYICIVSPNTRPQAEDVVYVRNKEGQATLKKYISENSQWIQLQGWTEGKTASYTDKIKKDHTVLIAPVIYVKRRT